MPIIVSIKFNEHEAEVLRRAHAASGTTGLSSHIKQVYFDALKLDVEVLQEIRSDLERISSKIERLGDLGDGGNEPEMLLSIVCGLYLMVRRSVGESIRAQADMALDFTAIETYLKGR